MNFKLYLQKVKCDFTIWLQITNSLFFFVFVLFFFLLKKTMTLHVYSHFMYHIFNFLSFRNVQTLTVLLLSCLFMRNSMV